MTIQYVNTNAGDSIGPHDVLRVSFAEEPHWYVPDEVASANLRTEVDNLVATLDAGGAAVVPASDVTVPPGALAWTIDFVSPQGYTTVGNAVSQLDAGLRTLVLSNGYIARVEKVTGAAAGAPDAGTTRGATDLTVEQQLQQTALGAELANIFGTALVGFGVVGGVVLLLVYAPELKAGLKAVTRGRA